jgi:hypothetical protein
MTRFFSAPACLLLVSVFLAVVEAQSMSHESFAVAHAVPGPTTASQPDSKKDPGVWLQYHRLILPIAVGVFFLSFGGWSLTAVENAAIRRHVA